MFNTEMPDTRMIIERLTTSGMIVEQVGENAYNIISSATGAVLERVITALELARYMRGMDYIATRHGKQIAESFSYTKPVHS